MSKQLQLNIEKGEGPLSSNMAYCHNLRGLQTQQTKFEGQRDELKGIVLNCSQGFQTDEFFNNMRNISEYVGRDYAFSTEINRYLDNEVMVAMHDP